LQIRPAPQSENELLQRAKSLSGCSLGIIANQLGWAVPTDLRRHKGWVGQLVEAILGAEAGNQAKPDFLALNIELKTLPVTKAGQPQVSTYVCAISHAALSETWHSSVVYQKLSRVLWVPIEGSDTISITERRILKPFLWEMGPDIEIILRQDWEELMEALALGYGAGLSAHQGTYLQVRPKAAHSRIKTAYLDVSGERVSIVPKGFYLRPAFTRHLLKTSPVLF